MENKRARFKSWKGNENVVREEIYHTSVYDFDSEELGSYHQSCICDPAFINDSSSSNSVSGDSCVFDDFDSTEFHQQDLEAENQLRYDNSYQKIDAPEAVCTPNESLLCQGDVTAQGAHPRYIYNTPVKRNSTDSLALIKDCQNRGKVLSINGSVEPHHVHRRNLPNNSPKLFSGCENDNNKSQSLSGSDSCTFIEEGSSKRIRSILKKNNITKKDSLTKKKVTFNLNDDETGTGSDFKTRLMKISSPPNRTTLNRITKTNTKLISPSTDGQNIYSETAVIQQTTETESNILDKIMESESFYNNDIYTANENIKSNLSYEKSEDSISSVPEFENINLLSDLGHINEEELEKEGFDEEKISIEGSSSEKYDTIKKSVTSSSVGIQSDFNRNTTTKEGISSNLKVPLQAHDESQTENKEENEYSLFIRDLVTGSGDRLANFLIRLSSEISGDASQEKLQNALMNGVYSHQEIPKSESLLQVENEGKQIEDDNENYQTTIQENTLQNSDRNTQMATETKIKVSKYKNIGRSMNNCQPNKSLNNDSLNEDYFIEARKSMSLINIHQSNPRGLFSKNNCLENKRDTASVSKIHSNNRNACTEQNGLIINNDKNKNDNTIGELHELLAKLRESIEKIGKKESTIHIDNAQIWLNSSRSYEHIPPDQAWTEMRKKKKITDEEMIPSKLNKTKDTYSQTILTAGINLRDYLQREITKEAENETEIYIHSNNKNEEINLKINEKKKHMKDSVLAVESKENQTMYLPTIKVYPKENEILNGERESVFVEKYDPIVDDDRKLPFLKRGKYDFEIFEQINEPVIGETSFKNLLNKILDQMTAVKLNGLQNYKKRSTMHHIQSSKLKTTQNPTNEKPAGSNFFQSFLNKISKSNSTGSKNSSSGHTDSKQFMGLKNQFSILNSILPTKYKEGCSTQLGSDVSNGLNNVKQWKQLSVNSIKCNHRSISVCDENQWPDIIKTKYPNGMVHFGPLARMPEPDKIVNIDSQSMELDTCSEEFHQYSYNQTFSETEQEIYYWRSQVENV